MAGCDNNCDAVAGLHEAAANLIQYSKLIESWLYGAQDQTVDVGGVTTPTLLNLINSIRQFVGVWPDGQTIKFCPDKKIYVPLKEGGGISADNDGLFADVARPDGVTTNLNEDGLLSALGGNLLTNDEIWITESGTFTVPVTGWYDLWIAAGGQGGSAHASSYSNDAIRGRSGIRATALRYYTKGQEINVVIGAGGAPYNGSGSQAPQEGTYGGDTTFGDIIVHAKLEDYITPGTTTYEDLINGIPRGATQVWGVGVRETNTNLQTMAPGYEICYGAGGYAGCGLNSPYAQPGVQGAVRLRFWNPAKAAGPAPEPTLP